MPDAIQITSGIAASQEISAPPKKTPRPSNLNKLSVELDRNYHVHTAFPNPTLGLRMVCLLVLPYALQLKNRYFDTVIWL
jgi:hypothetical protein